ncbi:deSI-like protein At4g17486 [Prosopis cineraria]|uniref:deSI-like protein At4g17486 n=1 Tax=Prosopis cineraria TaxID=364024 RepID=UPI00240EBFC2|nr:deSI-like protein At4g17486 [Prosopis cineraria]
MLCRKGLRNCESGSVPVYLNVYDLTPINGYAYWFGLGVYHSGVQVHGVEYAFGAHEYSSTGIFEGEPRRCEGFAFRTTILIGKTEKGEEAVRSVMEELAGEYRGNAYNLITKNCNHFCNDACLKLTGKPIPSWINRLAKIGFLCKCVLPVAINSTRVRHHRIEDKHCEEKQEAASSSSSTSVPLKTSDKIITIQMQRSSSTSETNNNNKVALSNSTSSPPSPSLASSTSSAITRPDLPQPSSPVIIEPSPSPCPNSEH